MTKLTALGVKRQVSPGWYGDGGGLWLQVRDAERRSWLFRYVRHGKAREMGLGPFRDMSLAEAREAATTCRKALLAGLDPIEERAQRRLEARNKAQTTTFSAVAEKYIESHGAGWRNPKHRAQWLATIATFANPVFGDKPVSAVDTALVLKVLQPIWTEKPETASRLRGRIEAILSYAAAQGWRIGENPARWRGHLANLLPATRKIARVRHHPALPYAEMPEFMSALLLRPGTASLALRFTMLTAARTGEVIGARWQEIDGLAWTVPAERMKAGMAHSVPLSAAALAILAELRPLQVKPADFVFPGTKAGLSNMSMAAVLKRMDRLDITVHGFRSCFRDWAAETTAYPREVAEAALAHTLSDKVEKAYRRSDLFPNRIPLMNDWAAFCMSAEMPVRPAWPCSG